MRTKEMKEEKINAIAEVLAHKITEGNPKHFNELHKIIADGLREWMNAGESW